MMDRVEQKSNSHRACEKTFAIPGIGPLLVAGPLVTWIVGALEGAVMVGGLSALGAGLFSTGVPKNSVLEYEAAVKSDKFLLLVSGNASEVRRAKEILDTTEPAHVGMHSHEEALVASR